LIVAALLAGRLVQAWYQHRELVRWLDALGDMAGDLLRGILEEVRKEDK
jgi:hypothetical protein